MGGASVTGTKFSSSASAVARNICSARRFPNPLKNEQITLNDKATHLANFAFHLVTLIDSWPKICPMVLGKLPVPGRPTILITVGQGPIALAVGAGGGGLDIFTLIYPFSLSLGDGPI